MEQNHQTHETIQPFLTNSTSPKRSTNSKCMFNALTNSTNLTDMNMTDEEIELSGVQSSDTGINLEISTEIISQPPKISDTNKPIKKDEKHPVKKIKKVKKVKKVQIKKENLQDPQEPENPVKRSRKLKVPKPLRGEKKVPAVVKIKDKAKYPTVTYNNRPIVHRIGRFWSCDLLKDICIERLKKLNDFFTDDILFEYVVQLNRQNFGVSQRTIDWLVTNYTVSHPITLVAKDDPNKIPFNINADYQSMLTFWKKEDFDVFRRHNRLYFHAIDPVDHPEHPEINMDVQGPSVASEHSGLSVVATTTSDNIEHTTFAQLNFVYWAVENGVMKYCLNNKAAIAADMAQKCKKRKAEVRDSQASQLLKSASYQSYHQSYLLNQSYPAYHANQANQTNPSYQFDQVHGGQAQASQTTQFAQTGQTGQTGEVSQFPLFGSSPSPNNRSDLFPNPYKPSTVQISAQPSSLINFHLNSHLSHVSNGISDKDTHKLKKLKTTPMNEWNDSNVWPGHHHGHHHGHSSQLGVSRLNPLSSPKKKREQLSAPCPSMVRIALKNVAIDLFEGVNDFASEDTPISTSSSSSEQPTLDHSTNHPS